MFVEVYTCQNATLLEITRHGSNGSDSDLGQNSFQWSSAADTSR